MPMRQICLGLRERGSAMGQSTAVRAPKGLWREESSMAKNAAKASPFAPGQLPDMPAVPGVRLAACEAAIRYRNRRDLMLAVLAPGTTAAGLLTRSKTASAPVLWCRQCLAHGN